MKSDSQPSHIERTMRRLSKDPSQRNRFAVYGALLSAQLVVPLKENATQRDSLPVFGDLAIDESMDGQGAQVVFTDDTQLPRWRQGGGPRARVAGKLLFPLLAAGGCRALLINPKGHVGGMLYGHEVQSIAEAALRS